VRRPQHLGRGMRASVAPISDLSGLLASSLVLWLDHPSPVAGDTHLCFGRLAGLGSCPKNQFEQAWMFAGRISARSRACRANVQDLRRSSPIRMRMAADPVRISVI